MVEASSIPFAEQVDRAGRVVCQSSGNMGLLSLSCCGFQHLLTTALTLRSCNKWRMNSRICLPSPDYNHTVQICLVESRAYLVPGSPLSHAEHDCFLIVRVVVRTEVLPPGQEVGRDKLQLMIYRRLPSQAYTNAEIVAKEVDVGKAHKTKEGSKRHLQQTLQAAAPSLNNAVLEHFRMRVGQQRNAYLAMPLSVFEALRGTQMSTALETSGIASSLPAAPARDTMRLRLADGSHSSQKLLDDDSMGISYDDDDYVPSAREIAASSGQSRGPLDESASSSRRSPLETSDDSSMVIFRVVHPQPNRLKRWGAAIVLLCHACSVRLQC